MRDGDRSYPGVQLAAWNVTEDQLHRRYFPGPTRWTNVIAAC